MACIALTFSRLEHRTAPAQLYGLRSVRDRCCTDADCSSSWLAAYRVHRAWLGVVPLATSGDDSQVEEPACNVYKAVTNRAEN